MVGGEGGMMQLEPNSYHCQTLLRLEEGTLGERKKGGMMQDKVFI